MFEGMLLREVEVQPHAALLKDDAFFVESSEGLFNLIKR